MKPVVATVFAAAAAGAAAQTGPVSQTMCNGQSYTYQSLAGFGYLPGNARDQFGDTLGGFGSSIALDLPSWTKIGNNYTGILYAIPDRGWNTEGTLNYQGRVHRMQITLSPMPNATVASPAPNNIQLRYLNSVLLTDPQFKPTTGLDGDPQGHLTYFGYPDLPVSTFTGDGFGGPGPGGRLVPVDNEGLVLGNDGTFWISDEYGPYIYHYLPSGQMIGAIRPPDAIIPRRNGTESFSADSPSFYSNMSDDVSPTDPQSGRENNHGFECLTKSPDGRSLYVMLQEAATQEGGTKKSTENNVRLLHYDISKYPPAYVAEYAVALPFYPSGSKPNSVGVSEMHYISDTQFLVLARDSGAGQCQKSTMSLYRHADVIDISQATNIKGAMYDCANCSIAPNGVLAPGITPAKYCSFLDYNVNSQLERFGVHNGGAADAGLLNEKWESLALAPQTPGKNDGNYILFSISDNDFITQSGRMNFGRFPYSDSSGCNLNNQILAFNVHVPSATLES